MNSESGLPHGFEATGNADRLSCASCDRVPDQDLVEPYMICRACHNSSMPPLWSDMTLRQQIEGFEELNQSNHLNPERSHGLLDPLREALNRETHNTDVHNTEVHNTEDIETSNVLNPQDSWRTCTDEESRDRQTDEENRDSPTVLDRRDSPTDEESRDSPTVLNRRDSPTNEGRSRQGNYSPDHSNDMTTQPPQHGQQRPDIMDLLNTVYNIEGEQELSNLTENEQELVNHLRTLHQAQQEQELLERALRQIVLEEMSDAPMTFDGRIGSSRRAWDAQQEMLLQTSPENLLIDLVEFQQTSSSAQQRPSSTQETTNSAQRRSTQSRCLPCCKNQ